MKHIINLSGGKDSTAMLLMMLKKNMPSQDAREKQGAKRLRLGYNEGAMVYGAIKDGSYQ